MRAVRLHAPLDLRVEEIDPPPSPPAGFVNVQVRAAGICGSDLHNYRTGQWISRSPSTAGHEIAGMIIALGTGATDLKVGDAVVVDSRVSCGQCPACRSAMPNICEKLGFVGEVCDGGFAEVLQVPAHLVERYDNALPARVAAMAEPLAVALHTVRRLHLPSQEPVLIVGCGAIGALCALVISRTHDGPVLVSDLNPQRMALVAKAAKGQGTQLEKVAIAGLLSGRRLRYAIDATGNVGAIATVLEMLSGGGTFALVGIGHGKLSIDPSTLVEREISLVGCHAFTDELPAAVGMLRELAGELEELSQVHPSLEMLPDLYERLSGSQTAAPKTIVLNLPAAGSGEG